MLGITSWSSGKFLEGQERLERALNHYDPVRDSSLAFTFIMDPRVAALMFLALSLWSLGHIDRAVRCADEAVEWASELDHVFTLVQALAHRCLLDTVLGNHDFTLANSRILLDLTHKFDLRLLEAYGAFLHEWARWSAGESDARPEHMRKAIGLLRQQGAGLDLPHFETLLSMAQGAAGDVEGALAHLDGVVAEIERSDQRWSEAEAYRVRGELLLKREPIDRAGAEASFRRGLDIARAQQARSNELRAATSLARLWRDQGRRIEARAVLAPVYDWFSEGFHTRDLKEAKALLDELA